MILIAISFLHFSFRSQLINDTNQSILNSFNDLISIIVKQISFTISNGCTPDHIPEIENTYSKQINAKVSLIIPNCGKDLFTKTNLNVYLNQPDIYNAFFGKSTNRLIKLETPDILTYSSTQPIKINENIVGIIQVEKQLEDTTTMINSRVDSIIHLFLLFIPGIIIISLIITSLYIPQIKKLTQETLCLSNNLPNDSYADFRRDEIGKLSKALRHSAKLVKNTIDSFLGDNKIFSSVLNNFNNGILIIDDLGRVSLINQTASNLFCIEEKDVINRTLVEVIRYFQIEELWRKCKQSWHKESISFETIPDHLYINCIATPLEPQLHGSVMLILQDLTRMHQLEVIRRDFTTNVSHQLRTPLASIKALKDTLQDGALDDKENAKKFLLLMDTEINNLTQMVEELLELSKIESGQAPIEKHPVVPIELIQQSVDRMQLQAERAGLKISIECPKNLAKINVDRQRIEQVFMNLIHNSIKFTPPNGEIKVSAKANATEVIFTVKDNGTGIPPKDLERIFERFYKTDKAGSQKGTGLGLSIARHLVEAHGGKIWVESVLTQGSTFFFSIPIA